MELITSTYTTDQETRLGQRAPCASLEEEPNTSALDSGFIVCVGTYGPCSIGGMPVWSMPQFAEGRGSTPMDPSLE